MSRKPVVSKVTEDIYLSAAVLLEPLRHYGFKSVFNLSGKPLPGRTRTFRLIDGRGNDPEDLIRIVRALDKRVAAKRTPVLVHCWAGRSRSVICVALWMAWRSWRWSNPGVKQTGTGALDEALVFIKKCHPRSSPNQNLVATAEQALWRLRND